MVEEEVHGKEKMIPVEVMAHLEVDLIGVIGAVVDEVEAMAIIVRGVPTMTEGMVDRAEVLTENSVVHVDDRTVVVAVQSLEKHPQVVISRTFKGMISFSEVPCIFA